MGRWDVNPLLYDLVKGVLFQDDATVTAANFGVLDNGLTVLHPVVVADGQMIHLPVADDGTPTFLVSELIRDP